jgi:peptidyl-tRNA hydrolase
MNSCAFCGPQFFCGKEAGEEYIWAEPAQDQYEWKDEPELIFFSFFQNTSCKVLLKSMKSKNEILYLYGKLKSVNLNFLVMQRIFRTQINQG